MTCSCWMELVLDLISGFPSENSTLSLYTPWKLIWQWKIQHLKMYISYWTWGFPMVNVSFRGGGKRRVGWLWYLHHATIAWQPGGEDPGWGRGSTWSQLWCGVLAAKIWVWPSPCGWKFRFDIKNMAFLSTQKHRKLYRQQMRFDVKSQLPIAIFGMVPNFRSPWIPVLVSISIQPIRHV